jgi:hypothetical protein
MSFEFPDDARHPALRQFYDYWVSKCVDGRPPARHDVDPVEMKPFLRYVIMFDVERVNGVYRFRHRLVGTHIVELFAEEVTGRYVDEMVGDDEYPRVYRRLVDVVERQEPVYGTYHAPTPHRDFAKYEHLTVPLAAEGGEVDLLLGVRCGLGFERSLRP